MFGDGPWHYPIYIVDWSAAVPLTLVLVVDTSSELVADKLDLKRRERRAYWRRRFFVTTDILDPRK